MRTGIPGRAGLAVLFMVATAGCEDDSSKAFPDGAVPASDGGRDSGPTSDLDAQADAAIPSDAQTALDAQLQSDAQAVAPDAGTPKLSACVERPDQLPRPPFGSLPCELLPPGFMR